MPNFKIVARPWQPQDLIDDLQSIIDEECDNYLNTRRTTLCMARDYLKEHFAEQKWISVKERLPEDVYGKDREKIVVLVRTKSGNVSQCARMADYEIAKDSTLTKVKWIKNGQFYWSKGKKVTHWMPLPQQPKGE